MNSYKILHHYNSGDLITILPGLKKLYRETGTKTTIYQYINFPAFYYEGADHPIKYEGQQVCFNQETFDLMKPLIESQEYIESFREWKGEAVDLDFQITRDRKYIPMPYGDIYTWSWFVFPQLACDLSKEWLSINHLFDSDFDNKIVINFTDRYRNPYIQYYFLKESEKDIIFVGTPEEHKAFNEKWNLNIEYFKVKDFLELAKIIDNCAFFLGNQSLCFHLSNAMKVPRILEVCSQFPNTMPNGNNGYAFIYQDALSFYFNQLKENYVL